MDKQAAEDPFPIDVIQGHRADHGRLMVVGAVLASELIVLALAYGANFEFTCRAAVPAFICQFLSLAVERAVFFAGVLIIMALSKPQIVKILGGGLPGRDERHRWLVVQMAGFALVLLPLSFMADTASRAIMVLAFALWGAGAVLMTSGTAFSLLTYPRWKLLVQEIGTIGLALLTLSIAAPEIIRELRGIWFFEPLTTLTFNAVVALLDLFGVDAIAKPAERILATKGFAVAVGWQCSGVEGFGLTILFLLCYFFAFARDLMFPHVWVLVPVSLALSWLLNVVRIAVLFAIGSKVSPALAVNGFHSHAGWLMFSVLALSVIAVSRTVPWFQRQGHVPAKRPVPLRQDWFAARILPFGAFMGSALLLSTFTVVPDLWYILKMIVIAATLTLFLPLYRKITWRVDKVSLVVGGAIGIFWILGTLQDRVAGPLDAALLPLPTWLFIGWIVARVAGTILVVPLVEELFFRGYVLDRFLGKNPWFSLLGLGLSTALFAVLHGQWLLAAIAAVAYGLLYVRSRLISDAVLAHAASNSIIAAYAVATLNWSII